MPLALALSSYASRVWYVPDYYAQETHHVVSDRKSTRLNSSHKPISYAVFCFKKKKTTPSSNTNSQHTDSISPRYA